MATFSDRLKELRKAAGVTQVEVARQCGMTERAYQRLESGNKPNHDNLMALADYFGITTDYLLGRTDYWMDAEGRVTVKTPLDIFNDTNQQDTSQSV